MQRTFTCFSSFRPSSPVGSVISQVSSSSWTHQPITQKPWGRPPEHPLEWLQTFSCLVEVSGSGMGAEQRANWNSQLERRLFESAAWVTESGGKQRNEVKKKKRRRQRRLTDSVKRNENIRVWRGGASETGCQRSVVIVRQALGSQGLLVTVLSTFRIMAYGGGGMVCKGGEWKQRRASLASCHWP